MTKLGSMCFQISLQCVPYVSSYCGVTWMKPDTSFHQFSREVWETVNDQAMNALLRKDFSQDDSRIESIRCVHLEEENDSDYGRQIWFFEASGVDATGQRHRLYGALDFSVQYGLLEPARVMLMSEPHHRQRFLQSVIRPAESQAWAYPSTKVWVRLTVASVIILTSIWLLTVAALMLEQN